MSKECVAYGLFFATSEERDAHDKKIREEHQEEENKGHTCTTCTTTMNHDDWVEGKKCCDNPLFGDEEDEEDWFNEKYPNATCSMCDKHVDGETVVYCGGAGGACETWFCEDCWEEDCGCEVCREDVVTTTK